MTYNEAKTFIVIFSLLAAGGVFLLKIRQYLWANLRRGQPSGPYRDWGRRLASVATYVGGQKRLFRFLVPGTAHFFIFWGFVFLSLTIVQALLEGLTAAISPELIIPILDDFGPLALMQDLFALFVILAVIYALYLRLQVNPERYQGSNKRQGVLVLIFILTIMVSLLIMNGIRINLGEDPLADWRPVSSLVGIPFAGLNNSTQLIIGEISYWIHLFVVLIFLVELPLGKHFHVITSIPAVFLRNLDPPGRLLPPGGGSDFSGVSEVDQFRWRQMLDFYTCTECGRCQEVCPAYASGYELSPKHLMMALRDHLNAAGPGINGNASEQLALVGDVLTEDEIWACATCYACDQECPLLIEHIPLLVDMRRHLVMEGRVDTELQEVLANLGRYGNSFGQSPRKRAMWSRNFKPKVKDARKEPVEYLWFLGDYASYNPTLTEITRKTSEVFQTAELDYGILYDAEQNSGNDVRRVGEEGLFELLVEKNIAALEASDFSQIITTDPHSYNTLKNEYPFNGHGPQNVWHYSELLDDLISSERLPINNKLDYRVTYHDPCYLGRYNGIYDAPRRVIEATGCELVEMPRNHDRALCCGAGGGRIWMAEGDIKERPSELRIREAVELDNVDTLVVTCPKDVTMFQDAVKTTGNEEELVVKDLIELVHEAITP